MSRLPPVELAIPIGVVTEDTDRGTRGRYNNCDKIRFRQGLPEKLGGWVLAALSADYAGIARAAHDWTDIAGDSWLAIGTHAKLYLVDSSLNLYDITPIRGQSSLTDPFSTTTGLSTVVVDDVAHGAIVGDTVNFSGASAVGGLTLSGGYVVTQVNSVDQYVVDAGTAASGTATGGGSVTADYEINVGYQSAAIGQEIRVWSLINFGEDLVASPRGGALYLWDRTAGPSTRAVAISNAPSKVRRIIMSPQARHVMALGADTGSFSAPGDENRLLIRWCDQENYTIWTSLTTNRAGDLPIDRGKEIVTGIESRGDIIVFTDEALHAFQYTSSDLVFTGRFLGSSPRIVGPNAAVDANGVVFYMAKGQFMVYDGVIRVLECPVLNRVFDDINEDQTEKIFASQIVRYTEVQWLYPSAASSEPDRYVKYNYKDNAWDFGTLDRTAYHDRSGFLSYPYALQGGKLYSHEIGVDGDDDTGTPQAIESFIETGDVEVDQAGSALAHARVMIPDFKTLVGTVSLTIRGRKEPHAARYEKGPFVITATTERVSVRFRARQISLRVESNALGDDWRMGTWRTEARPRGRR